MRQLEFLEGAIEAGTLFRPSLGAGGLDRTANMELGFPCRFLGERDSDDAIERANAGADESYDAPYEGGRFSGSGRRLDKEGRVEFFCNAAARLGICEFRHGAPRNAIKGAILPSGLRVMRRSSWGPHTTR
jgi:hypothetical protein